MRTWLTGSGALAALLVGGAVGWGAGWRALALLFVFFISSSLLTKGGGRRRAAQVFANGGLAALTALLSSNEPSWLLGFAGALAAATADTWSTEIGARSKRSPRLITTWRAVPAGTDGGITLPGTAGGVAGAGLIAGAAFLLGLSPAHAVARIALAGILGTLVDSVLGASAQRRSWMNNDAVNWMATLTGVVVAMALQ